MTIDEVKSYIEIFKEYFVLNKITHKIVKEKDGYIRFSINNGNVPSIGEFNIGINFNEFAYRFRAAFLPNKDDKENYTQKIDFKNNKDIYYNILYYFNKLNSNDYVFKFYIGEKENIYFDFEVLTEDLSPPSFCYDLLKFSSYFEESLYNIIYKDADPEEEAEITIAKLNSHE